MKKEIKQIHRAMPLNMGGIVLDQALPVQGLDAIDPILLIHHWKTTHPGGQNAKDLGVPPHPHRGFSPVTLVFQGEVHHRDSMGFSEVIPAGGTQWMNSGKGIMHSERPSQKLAEEGGDFEIIQFWMNSPAKYKLDDPFYKTVLPEETPNVFFDEGNIKIGVVAGEFHDVEGPVSAMSESIVLRAETKESKEVNIQLPEGMNTLVYVLEGGIEINQQLLGTKEMAVLSDTGEELTLKSNIASKFIILGGEPLNEPVKTYGPIVMNTQAEIIEALNAVQNGEFGELVEKFD